MKKSCPPSRIGRKRRALGWTLLTLGVLVAGVWVWSLVRQGGIYEPTWAAGLDRGQCWIETGSQLNPSPYWGMGKYGDVTPRIKWLCEGASLPQQSTSIFNVGLAARVDWKAFIHTEFVLWPIPLFLWTPAALLLCSGILARRRAMTGTCTKCGYSLAGLGKGVACPECGKEVAAT